MGASLELLSPSRSQAPKDRFQIGAGQVGFSGLTLEFSSVENQSKSIDLFAAFHINLLEAFHHQVWEILSSDQGADQCADRGQWRSPSWVSASSKLRSSEAFS